jgi:hypothetical protein
MFEFSLFSLKVFMHLKSMDTNRTTALQVLISEGSFHLFKVGSSVIFV